MDFDFKQSSSSSSTADPSTPRPYYHSAPTSPSRISDIKTTLTPKSPNYNYKHEFAFDLSQEMDTTSLSADQLFDGGIIRPLKPPPVSTRGRERERERVSPSRRTSTRSLSPFRVSEYPWEEEDLNTKESTTTTSSSSSSKGHRKWRLMDFFLFRSASEGRATGKDPLKKYASLFKSSRKVDRQGSGSRSSRKGPVSAHELHYTTNRAVSEDLKKKTFLPYKQGILGRLAFNPAVHALSNGFGFSHQ